MVNHTRLDCVIGVTGQMRAGLTQAIHHTRHRSAFGKLLVDQPLMRQVLADLAIESEAATLTMLRLAAGYDAGDDVFSRLATAVGKYWCCKRTPMFAAEALECFGGNGYVETGPMARLFRESPLNGIWEGSGNVIALDVLRAITREPELGQLRCSPRSKRPPAPMPASTGSSPTSTPSSPGWATAIRRPRPDGSPSAWPWRCRARCCCATPSAAVAEAFCASRLGRCRRADVRRLAGRRRGDGDRRARLALRHAASGPRRELPAATAHEVAVDVDRGRPAEEVRRDDAAADSGLRVLHDDPRCVGGDPSCATTKRNRLGEDVTTT